MSEPFRILHVEDSQDDAWLVLRNLRANGLAIESVHLDTADALREALVARQWDIALCDYAVPGLALATVQDLLREHAPDTPLVLVTGTIGEEAVADLMRGGIADVVLKNRLKLRLAVIVEREVGLVRLRRAAEQRRRRSETVLGFFGQATHWQAALDATLEYLATSFSAEVAAVSEITGDPPNFVPVSSWTTSRFAAFGAKLKTHSATPVSALARVAVTRGEPLVASGLPGRVVEGSFMVADAVAAGLRSLVSQPLLTDGKRFAITLMFADDSERIHGISAELTAISSALQLMLYRKSSEEHRTLLSSGLEEALSGVMITEVSPDAPSGSRIVYVNRAMCRMSGYERDELVGQTTQILVGPLTDAATVERLRDVLTVAGPIREELLTYRRDGTSFWVELHKTPVRDGQRVTHFVIVQTDITERRRAEAERQQREASFRVMFDNNPMPMWVYDVETLQFLKVNIAAIAHYGWTRSEFLSRVVMDVVPPEERAAVRARIPALHAHGAVSSGTHITATGEQITIRSAVHGISYEGRAANLAVVWDITEMEHARRELHRKNEELAQLTERLAVRTAELVSAAQLVRIGTWSMDFSPRRIVWSPETFSILGQDPALFLLDSNRVLASIHPDDRASSQEAYRAMMRDGIERPREFRIVRPSGEVRVLRELLQLRRDAQGRKVGLTGVLQDITEDVQLRHDAQRWADAVEHAGVGIRIVDAGTATVLYANSAFAAQHGMTRDEVVGKHLSVFYAPSERERIESLRSEIETVGHVVFEAVRQRKDGSVFPAMIAVTYVQPEDGSTPYRIGTTLDISNHKAAEAKAKREIRRWSDAVEHAGVGITIAETGTGAVEYANAAFAAQFGVPREEIGGRSVEDFYAPAERERLRRIREEVKVAGHLVYEADCRRHDGSVFPAMVSVTHVHPDDGSPPYRIGTILDLTDHKAAEARARREIQRWSDAVKHSGFGITIVDTATETVIYANPAFATLHRMPPDQVAGHRVLTPYPPAERARVTEILATLPTVGQVVFEADRLRCDGSVFPAIIAVTYVAPEDGSTPYRIGTVLDITKLKAAEAGALQMQRLATLGEMATGLAHELNQPLAVVNMAAQNAIALIEGGGDPASVVEKLRRMMEQTGRASEIVRNVTTFGRRSSGPVVATRIQDAVDNTLAMVQSRLRTSGIKVTRSLPSDLPEAMVTLVQLEQVLINLLVNATDAYAENDGTERVIRIGAWREGSEVVLAIGDAAGGISDAVLGRIFEPFFTTKPVGHGTGLGLSISYDIVTGAGGSMSVRNQDGGAMFEIRLPAAPVPVAPPFAGATLSRRPAALNNDPFETVGQM